MWKRLLMEGVCNGGDFSGFLENIILWVTACE